MTYVKTLVHNEAFRTWIAMKLTIESSQIAVYKYIISFPF
jgi:hypothetical protein